MNAYTLPEHILLDQAHLIAQRRTVIAAMQLTNDSSALWALGEIQRALYDAIREPFPIDYWWFWKQEQARQ